jgi:hypothetical protein
MTIRLNRMAIIAAVVLLLGLLMTTGSRAQAIQLQSSESSIPNICQYVSKGLRLDTTASSPAMFVNVQGIYISASISGAKNPIFAGMPPVRSGDLAKLSACTLEKRFTTNKNATPAIPIHVPKSGIPVAEWPEAKQDGELIVSVEVEMKDDGPVVYHDLFREKLVILHARYFRHDVNDLSSVEHQCATAFPYSENSDTFLQLLTLAMRHCLYQPYVSQAQTLNNGEQK